jgi:hypothetical protein
MCFNLNYQARLHLIVCIANTVYSVPVLCDNTTHLSHLSFFVHQNGETKQDQIHWQQVRQKRSYDNTLLVTTFWCPT